MTTVDSGLRSLPRLGARRLAFGQSDTIFVFLCTAVMLAAIASFVWLVAPHGAPIPTDVAGQDFVEQYASLLMPKPHERYIYLALILAAPLVISCFVRLRRAYPGSSEAPNGSAPLLLAVAAIACAIPHDEFRPKLFSGPSTAPLWFTALLSLTAAAWASMHWSAAARHRVGRAVTLLLCGLSIAVIASWRIYGTPTFARDVTAHHLDAVLYSVVQIYFGATCLHDVIPQYGCYGEFLAVPLRLTGPSVASVLAILAALEAVAMVAIIRYARSLIRDPFVLLGCGLWLVIVTNQIFWILVQDIYAQYWPLRILFPALSLSIVQSWPRRPSHARAFGIGVFSAAGVFWNLDSGVVVFAALGAFLLLSGLTARSWIAQNLSRNLKYLSSYLAGFVAFSGAFYMFLSYKAGAWIDPSGYTVFQKFFYITGFFMLPMPPPPDMWLVAACLPLGPMILVALRVGRGPASPRLERAAYLAILSIGVFGYFTGRSHPLVFVLVSWPFVILAFFLLDRLISSPTATLGRASASLVAAAGLVTAGTLIYAQAGHVMTVSLDRWSDMAPHRPASAIDQDAAFIKGLVKPGETVGILADRQAALIAGVGRLSAIPGTGLIETIRTHDSDATIGWLVNRGPSRLFLSPGLVDDLPWLRKNSDRIMAVYTLVGWGPDSRLAHFERRKDPVSVLPPTPQ